MENAIRMEQLIMINVFLINGGNEIILGEQSKNDVHGMILVLY